MTLTPLTMSTSPHLRFGLLALALGACAIDDRQVSSNAPATHVGIADPADGGGADEVPSVENPIMGAAADSGACAIANGGCDPLTICSSTAEGRACGACPPGYLGDGSVGCVDINECELGPAVAAWAASTSTSASSGLPPATRPPCV
jgi:hypothetical protein